MRQWAGEKTELGSKWELTEVIPAHTPCMKRDCGWINLAGRNRPIKRISTFARLHSRLCLGGRITALLGDNVAFLCVGFSLYGCALHAGRFHLLPLFPNRPSGLQMPKTYSTQVTRYWSPGSFGCRARSNSRAPLSFSFNRLQSSSLSTAPAADLAPTALAISHSLLSIVSSCVPTLSSRAKVVPASLEWWEASDTCSAVDG